RLAEAGLDGPARVAAVPGSKAARAIVRRLTRVSAATVIGGRRRRGIIWRGAIIRRGPVVGRRTVVRRRRSVIGIRSNAKIDSLRRCRACGGDHRRQRTCCDLGHSCLVCYGAIGGGAPRWPLLGRPHHTRVPPPPT